jgi:hypothetical protein
MDGIEWKETRSRCRVRERVGERGDVQGMTVGMRIRVRVSMMGELQEGRARMRILE